MIIKSSGDFSHQKLTGKLHKRSKHTKNTDSFERNYSKKDPFAEKLGELKKLSLDIEKNNGTGSLPPNITVDFLDNTDQYEKKLEELKKRLAKSGGAKEFAWGKWRKIGFSGIILAIAAFGIPSMACIPLLIATPFMADILHRQFSKIVDSKKFTGEAEITVLPTKTSCKTRYVINPEHPAEVTCKKKPVLNIDKIADKTSHPTGKSIATVDYIRTKYDEKLLKQLISKGLLFVDMGRKSEHKKELIERVRSINNFNNMIREEGKPYILTVKNDIQKELIIKQKNRETSEEEKISYLELQYDVKPLKEWEDTLRQSSEDVPGNVEWVYKNESTYGVITGHHINKEGKFKGHFVEVSPDDFNSLESRVEIFDGNGITGETIKNTDNITSVKNKGGI